MVDLTEQQKTLIANGWAVIKKNLKQNGADAFILLFTMKPAYQDYFSTFKGMSMEEIALSGKMRAHGSMFMGALAGIIENLDDLECAAEILRSKVQSHEKRNIGRQHFHDLLYVVFPAFLAQKLGKDFTDEAGAAWMTAVGILMSVIDDELAKMEQLSVA
ncbi:hypothetical protein CAPTEDRAFT_218767 [Capitella teleta]|uniref:Globin domain-containing protein n=1 Tax=Capitella teleta TaxID=283909 RepID=R7T5E2_CAPTE|nr:hypothetical protein CAPTEDRAFT_218767 [Capitella teleta]|eukprot:ELT88554.1 hypothetical protein CAPTEDRAFT_218767 [Capitella teleta]